MPDSDDELLEQAVVGDASALRTLLKRFGPQVRQSIEGRIGKPWQALLDEDDVMQVAYLEAFLHIDQLTARDAPGFVAWLRRIAQNALRDAIKGFERQKRPGPSRRVQAPVGADAQTTLLSVLGVTTTTPSRHAARSDATESLSTAIAQLPPDYRTVVERYDLEARPAEDVAASMGRSVGAIYMLRARAHDRLRQVLGSGAQFFSGP